MLVPLVLKHPAVSQPQNALLVIFPQSFALPGRSVEGNTAIGFPPCLRAPHIRLSITRDSRVKPTSKTKYSSKPIAK